MTGKELQENNIRKLIDNHLVAAFTTESNTQKEHYRVTTENLVDFIQKYFTFNKLGITTAHKLKD